MVLTAGTAQLYYEVIGTGKPLVLLHGNGEDHSYFKHQTAFFVQHGWQVILMDMRGHGRSSFGQERLTFSLFAKDVKALLDHLRITKADLLGFSDGANTAMRFALAYPESLSHLILNAGNIHPLGMKFSLFLDIWRGYLHEQDQLQKQILALMARQPHITVHQLAQISVSTLVIAGENDMIRDAHTRKTAQAIPQAQLIILPQCDHFAARDAHAAFNQIVYQFLKGS